MGGITTDTYLSCAETAKLVRKALKIAFPTTKFSVRSSTYSGGASISIGWTDGPTGAAVDAVTQPFAGADFDGMIDLKTYNEHWLMSDGSVQIAHARGTEGSRGYLPEVITDPPDPSARLVRFGADFVQTQRRISDAWTTKLKAEVDEFGKAVDPASGYAENDRLPVSSWHDRDAGGVGLAHDRHMGEYGSTLVWQLAAMRDRSRPCDHATGTYGVAKSVHRCKGCGLRCSTAKTTTEEGS